MKRKVSLSIVFITILFLACTDFAQAALVGKVSLSQGRVEVLKPGKSNVIPVKTGDPVDVGDIYRVKSDGRAEISFLDGGTIKIAPSSRVQIKDYSSDANKTNNVIRLATGHVQVISGKAFIQKVAQMVGENKFEVHTPNAVAGIRGSNMIVGFIRSMTSTIFVDGKGYQYNPGDPSKTQVNIVKGQISFVSGSAPPTPPRKATPAETSANVNVVTTTPGGSSGGSGTTTTTTSIGTDAAITGTATTTPAGSSSTTTPATSTGTLAGTTVSTLPYIPPTETTTNTPASTGTYFKSNISTPLSYYSSPSGNATLFGSVNSPISFQLTWGATPYDMDAHAWVPYNSYYHVYYGNHGTLNSYPYTYLDKDDTSGYGPETITIYQFTNGNTYYSVENYSGYPSITASSAVVVVKDKSGNTITTYNVPASGSGDWWNVLFLQASGSGTASLYTINSIGSDNILTSWQNSGSINATLEGTGPLWTEGTGVPVSVTGTGYGGSGSNAKIASSIIYSKNNNNSQKTTSDGGAYYGVLSGSEIDGNIIARLINLYINSTGAGFIKGALTGIVNAANDTFGMSGTVYTTKIASDTGIAPADLYNYITTYSYSSISPSGSGSFSAGGTFSDFSIRNYLYQRNITGQNWGIWDTQLGSKYSGTTGNDWTASLGTDVSTYRINRLEITGTQWSGKNLAGTVYGYGGDASSSNALSGKTWISIGEIIGSFNAEAMTSQSIMTGLWMETNKFFDMLANNQANLQAVNIPCVQVGSATLTGSGNGFSDFTINNAKFFSTTGGSAPVIWASNNVTGTYNSTPSTSTSFAIAGGGLQANVAMQRWDTVNNRWLAGINSGSGNLSGGSYTGPVNFKGAAAGNIAPTSSTAGTITGTAAGTAKH